MKKILYITNVPSPYRVKFFNELGKHCDLTVLFEKAASDERDRSWSDYQFENFQGIVLPGVSVRADMSLSFGARRHLKRHSYDVIVCTDFTTPTGMLALSCLRRKGIPYYLESDGGFPKSGRGAKEALKQRCISDAVGYFSTGDMHDQYYLTYGAQPERLIRYPFSSVSEREILSKPVSNAEKAALRNQLGIKEKYLVLTVGQFIHRKGFDVLLESATKFSDDVGFYFVGGEPTEEYLALQSGHSNVHFRGFQKPETLQQYFMAADLFVLPTREDIWGLVINEAMASSLPVVTTTRCLAGVEMIEPGRNGYLIPPEDSLELTRTISYLLSEPEHLALMAFEALKTARGYTIEAMVEKHLETFKLPGRMAEKA